MASLDNLFDRVDLLFAGLTKKTDSGVKTLKVGELILPANAAAPILKYYKEAVRVRQISRDAVSIKAAEF